MPLEIRPLVPALFDAWAGLFRASASGCFCRYWHFEGTKNEWLARLAMEPEVNAQEQEDSLRRGDATAGGLVAMSSGVVIGWMKLSAGAPLAKLQRLPVYRSFPVEPSSAVLTIGCVLVHPEHRRRGVARALLEAAISHAHATGAAAIDAYPHRRSESLRDEELWMGPYTLLEAAGFTDRGGNSAYPRMRLTIEARATGR